jgi:hypothetical protein
MPRRGDILRLLSCSPCCATRVPVSYQTVSLIAAWDRRHVAQEGNFTTARAGITCVPPALDQEQGHAHDNEPGQQGHVGLDRKD